MGQLDGKTAIITGAASGIGKATAKTFVREGARVVLADVEDERGRQVAQDLGDAAVYQPCDVSDEAQVGRLVDLAVQRFGKLDVMVNNAGLGGVVGPIDELPGDEFLLTVKVIFGGAFFGIKHAARVMKPQRRGVILSTSSTAAWVAGVSPHVYSACKAAVQMLSRSTAMELGEHNIRVNCVVPGAIVTPLAAQFVAGLYGKEDQARSEMQKVQPIPRPGLPQDVANAFLWLASDQASFVNGHALVVDGGLTGGQKWSDMPPWMRVLTPMRRPGTGYLP